VNTTAYSNGGVSATTNLIRIATPGINNTLSAVYSCNLDGDLIHNEATDGQTIAVSGLNKADLWAYLDWAALRPMTETEYEKICRGTLPRVLNEYPWGSTNLTETPNRTQAVNDGAENETFSSAVGLTNGRAALLGSTTGAGMFRCGIFATASSGREVSGAGFYGNMEMAGNVMETVIWIETGGTSFDGTTGDGTLTTAGEANIATWPDPNGLANTGTGLRGGTSYGYTGTSTLWGRTSYRYSSVANTRGFSFGGRGVR
jgi:hypothetical protein